MAKIIYSSQLWLKLYIFHSCRMIIDAPLLISPSHFWGEDAGQNRNEVIVIFFVLFCFDFVVVVVFFCYFVFCLLRSWVELSWVARGKSEWRRREQRWRNFWKTGWSEYGLFRAHRYHLELTERKGRATTPTRTTIQTRKNQQSNKIDTLVQGIYSNIMFETKPLRQNKTIHWRFYFF